MAQLTKSEILHVAKLAKLNLSEQEIEKFILQLNSVVNYIGELSEVNTDNTLPTNQTTGLTNVSREDMTTANELLTQDQALGGSDKTYNGYFKVGAILTERTDK